MEKYQISPVALLRIKRQHDLAEQISQDQSISPEVVKERRSTPRREPIYQIATFDANNPRIQGIIYDIHPKGLKTVGITVQADEVKTLVIDSKPFNVHTTFTFQALCRWSMINEYGACVAGFQIVSILPGGAKELRKLIDCLTVPA